MDSHSDIDGGILEPQTALNHSTHADVLRPPPRTFSLRGSPAGIGGGAGPDTPYPSPPSDPEIPSGGPPSRGYGTFSGTSTGDNSLPILGVIDGEGILPPDWNPNDRRLPRNPVPGFSEVTVRNISQGAGYHVCIHRPLLAAQTRLGHDHDHDIRPAKVLALIYFKFKEVLIEASIWIDTGSRSLDPGGRGMYGEPRNRRPFLQLVVKEITKQMKNLPRNERHVRVRANSLKNGTYVAPFDLHVLIHDKDGKIWAKGTWGLDSGPDSFGLMVEKARSAWAFHRKHCEEYIDYQRTGKGGPRNIPPCGREKECIMICATRRELRWADGPGLWDFSSGGPPRRPKRSSAVHCLLVDHGWRISKTRMYGDDEEVVPIVDAIYGRNSTLV